MILLYKSEEHLKRINAEIGEFAFIKLIQLADFVAYKEHQKYYVLKNRFSGISKTYITHDDLLNLLKHRNQIDMHEEMCFLSGMN